MTCTKSIAAYCTADAGGAFYQCHATVSDALAALCPDLYLQMGCLGFDITTTPGIDSSLTEYFDSVTGNLVAIVGYDANTDSHQCVAGSPSFTLPPCSGGAALGLGCPDAMPPVCLKPYCRDGGDGQAAAADAEGG